MDDSLKDLARSAKALLLVQLQGQADRSEWEKPEVLLSRAGFAPAEIAKMLNKKPAAVAKALQRAGKVT